jgi:hypothetical protein
MKTQSSPRKFEIEMPDYELTYTYFKSIRDRPRCLIIIFGEGKVRMGNVRMGNVVIWESDSR